MATTYPLSTLAAVVSPTGITAPSYLDIYASLQASFQTIYGVDAYIAPDSQDGQLLAIVARAIFDVNSAAIATFNSFSPATAQGVSLSNVVKINGIARYSSSFSSAAILLVGQVGATINNGVVGDTATRRWALPASVVIPLAGQITVTATCLTPGSVLAAANTINEILTPSLGWQSATNPAAAAPGAPVEPDSDLRLRQAQSVALPSRTVGQGIAGAVAGLVGVTQVALYENDTGVTDARGLPPHSIAVVVLGGDVAQIGLAIYKKKTQGCYTYGTTTSTIIDDYGIPNTIRFFIPIDIPIGVEIHLKALTGYSSEIGDRIRQSVVDYINDLRIGAPVYVGRIFLPAQLYGGPGVETFDLNEVKLGASGSPVGGLDIAIAFNEIASAILTDVTLMVT